MEQKTSPARIALKWGLISALAGIILTTIMYMTDLWKSPILGIVSIAIGVIFIILAMKDFKKESNGYMTYGEGLGIGTLTTTISSLINGAFNLLYQKVIDPSLLDKMRDYQYEKMEEKGMSEEQIEQAIAITSKFTQGGMALATSVIMGVILGFLLSLILAAIFKKKQARILKECLINRLIFRDLNILQN